MSWPAATLHVLDFEGSRRSGIVEYGIVTLAGGAIAGVHTRLCAPTGAIEAAETAAHGVRAADVAGAAPFAEEWELFSALRQTGPWAAHHAVVERALLRRVWPVPPAAPDFAASDPAAAPRVADWGPWLDTVRLCAHVFPSLPNYQLADLIHHFGLTAELAALAQAHCPPARRKPHCALHDALAAALLLQRLARAPAVAQASLGAVLALSAPPAAAAALRQGDLALES